MNVRMQNKDNYAISVPNNITLKYLKCKLFIAQGETDKT